MGSFGGNAKLKHTRII